MTAKQVDLDPPSPSSNGSSDSSHQPHPATGNEDEMKTTQDSKASLVDEALEHCDDYV